MTTGEKAIEKYNESNQMKKIWNLDQWKEITFFKYKYLQNTLSSNI